MNTLIVATDYLEKLILFTLLVLSIWSVSVMVDRWRVLQAQKLKDLEHLRVILESNNLEAVRTWCHANAGFVAGSLLAATTATKNAESIDRAVSSYAKSERLKLEKGLAVLATLGANAPFVGLFGTVLGIIRSFAYLGTQSGSAAVMSGVSQALYATAFGLFVAIPAVVGFNIFTKRIKDLSVVVDSLKDLYISKLS